MTSVDPIAVASPRAAPIARATIRAGQTRALYRQGLIGTLGNVVVALATAAVLWSDVAEKWRFLPLVVLLLAYIERPLQVRAFNRHAPGEDGLDRWRLRYFASALTAGVSWGVGALLLMPELPFTEQVFLIIVAIGLTAGALSTLGEVLSVFLAFALPLLLLTCVAMVTSFESHAETLGPLIGLYVVVLVKTSLVHGRSLENALVLSLQNAALAAELEGATRNAQAACQAKSEFLARMSHEIRTPMNGVLGTTELLRDAALPPREHHLARLAHSSSELLLALLNDILDMARIEAGRIELREAPCSIEGIVEDVAILLGVPADQKGLTLICHAAPEMPRQILADATRLRQILTNLAGNAVKFTPSGEVEVHATTRAGAAGEELVVRVRDTGVGIPREQHAAIFKAFEQVRSGGAQAIRGTGLGLAISARLAALMGGTIEVASAPGEGSCFTLIVPCQRIADATTAAAAPTLAGLRVLLCVPQPLERAALGAWLTDAGADVSACVDAQALGAAHGEVDAIVLDPAALGGKALAGAARATPILMLERPSATPLSVAACGDAYHPFPRPLQRSRLLAALASMVERAPPRVASRVRPGGWASFAGARVLVVDDDAINRTVARHLLERLDVRVDLAPDGHSALVALATERYDLVLMDYELPDLDGGTVTGRVRDLAVVARSGAPLPIVAVTAHALPLYHDACYAAGMDDVLTKPITAASLTDVLDRFVRRAAAQPHRESALINADQY